LNLNDYNKVLKTIKSKNMKNLIFGVVMSIFVTGCSKAQEGKNELRFIEVNGSSEMNVEPDEIRFQIGIEEYWKEEYQKGKTHRDFVTKIPLEEIEKNLIAALTEIGIVKNQIIIHRVGQYWSGSGSNFKKNKVVELILTDFSLVDTILQKVKVRGVNSMKISELKNKDLTKFRKEVKIEAIKAARRKAVYLLESVDEHLGGLISVFELDNNSNYFWRPQDMHSNYILSSNSEDSKDVNMRKIKLRYEIKVRFEIQ
tara:strand:- start:17629 stop:18396 length:768 start_codon:yes stop_codon:yes gene_type:complete